MAKATIRHLAIVAKDPEKLAEYYKRVHSTRLNGINT